MIDAQKEDDLRRRLVRVHAVCDALCNRMQFPGRHVVAAWVARLGLPSAAGTIRCPTVYGFDLVVDEATAGDVYRFGFYEPGTLDVMRKALRPGGVFVDAGASIGLMSLFASQCVGSEGRVLAFEPLPHRYGQLVESIRVNERSNVRAFPFGLANAARDLSIFTDRVSPSMVTESGSTASEQTHVERLDNVLAREGVERVDMIKVDVEGFELEVLEGCESVLRAPHPPILCVEYGVYDESGAGLIDFLRSLDGYRLYQLAGTKKAASRLIELEKKASPRVGDNLFCLPRGVAV